MDEVYELKSSPKGYALIINNENFNCRDLERREGSDKDFNQLRYLFRDLGFRVKNYYNLDSAGFMKTIKQFVKMDDQWKVDCAVLFVMTHGHKDRVNPRAIDLAMTDNKYISSDWVLEKFSNEYSEALINKPKLVFFQACRDNAEMNVQVRRPAQALEDEVDPLINDLLVVCACLPGMAIRALYRGYGAHRNSKHGSWFIQELYDVIRSDVDFSHLYEMLHKVDLRLRDRFVREKGNCYQGIYFENWSFNKLLFLSTKAFKVHKAARALITLSPVYRKSKDRRKRKPSTMRSSHHGTEDLCKALKGLEEKCKVSGSKS